MSEFTHANPETLTHRAVFFPALTIEFALYSAFAFVALFIRLFILDYAPLNADEAQQASAAWNFVRGTPDPFTGSPLLFTGNAILFLLFGATDAAARLLPALFGSTLVLLPALFRREMGRTGALIASMLLVFSPSLVFFSRNTHGAIIAVTCALAALGFGWRYITDRTPRDLYFAAGFTALALVSAREVWTIVIALLLLAFVVRAWTKSMGENTPASRHDVRFAAILFAVAFFGIATTFLMHREGLGAAFDLFGAWLGGLMPSVALFDPLRLLIVYEPLALFFGVAAVIQLAFAASTDDQNQIPLAAFALWIGSAFVLYSIGGDKHPARVVVLAVPLALMAGWYIGNWLERAAEATHKEFLLASALPVYLLALILAAFFYIVFSELATHGSVRATEMLAAAVGLKNSSGWLIALSLTIAIAAVTFLTLATVGLARAKDVGLAVLLTIFAAWTFRQTTLLNLYAGGGLNAQEYLVTRAASPNVRDLVNDLRDISRWRANDAHTLQLAADESLEPMLAWYLRDFRNAQFLLRPMVTPETHALLLPINAPAPAAGWMSQAYRMETVRGTTGISNPLRWLIFRDVGMAENIDLVLWIPLPQP